MTAFLGITLFALAAFGAWSLADSALRWLDAYFGDDR